MWWLAGSTAMAPASSRLTGPWYRRTQSSRPVTNAGGTVVQADPKPVPGLAVGDRGSVGASGLSGGSGDVDAVGAWVHGHRVGVVVVVAWTVVMLDPQLFAGVAVGDRRVVGVLKVPEV